MSASRLLSQHRPLHPNQNSQAFGDASTKFLGKTIQRRLFDSEVHQLGLTNHLARDMRRTSQTIDQPELQCLLPRPDQT